jgi:hypothetical protein
LEKRTKVKNIKTKSPISRVFSSCKWTNERSLIDFQVPWNLRTWESKGSNYKHRHLFYIGAEEASIIKGGSAQQEWLISREPQLQCPIFCWRINDEHWLQHFKLKLIVFWLHSKGNAFLKLISWYKIVKIQNPESFSVMYGNTCL